MADYKPIIYDTGILKLLPDGDSLDISNGHLKLTADGAKTYYGADNDLNIQFDGSEGLYTTINGGHHFVGGYLQVPGITTTVRDTLTPAAGMFIYNTTDSEIQRYEDGEWLNFAKILSSSLDVYVSTTGNDSTGDGTSGSPWATIDKALDYINSRILRANYTIYVEKGSYTETDILSIGHDNGGHITISGDYETDTLTLSSSSGSSGNWLITFTTSNTDYYTVGDCVLIYSASGGTNPEYVLGTLLVDSINPSTSVTLQSPVTVGTMASGAVSASVSIPQVKLQRRIYISSSLAFLYGIQNHISATSNFDYLMQIEPGLTPANIRLYNCIFYNTNATTYGTCRSYTVSKTIIRYCGFRHLYQGWFTEDILNPTYSGCTDCTIGWRAYAGATVSYVYGHFISNTTGIQAELESYAGSGGGTPYFVGNGTDASPARTTEGNQNSYMG